MAKDILIVDDEADIRDLVAGILEDEGFAARSAANSDQALAEIQARRPSMVFLDIWLQGSRMDGLELLDAIKAELGASGMKDMGRLMAELKSRHGPVLDMGRASGWVKESLG